MAETLNPYSTRPLDNEASVNRQRLLAVPEYGRAFEGELAYDVLRRTALVRLALDTFPDLGPLDDPLLGLAQKATQQGFNQLALEFGARIATLVAVLRDGHPENRKRRPLWNDEAWGFWATRQMVWLAGGLVEGALGEAAISHAQSLLGDVPHLVLSPYRRHAPLIGAARTVSDRERVRVLDFGQTTLKRGTAEYAQGALTRIHMEEGLSVPLDPPVELMEDLIALACRGWTGVVSMSMACYEVPCGGPVNAGDFGKFYGRTDHVPSYLQRMVGAERLAMIHDGTAAGRALAGSGRSAVIVLGTALGIGVPPETEEGLAPIAPEFLLQFG